VDAELKQHLDGMEARLKQHVSELEERMKQHVSEQCEQVETRLLTEFHKWASPLEARLRTHSAALRAVDLEVEALDDRVKKIEERPPQ
jgi:hypothetical protein